MAKKKQKLSQDELFEWALVPESEWPYQVPENWVWTRLDIVAIYKKGPFGSSITKAMFVPKGIDTYKVYEQGNAIRKDKNYGNYYITKEKYNELKGFKVESGDLIVSCAGTIGETYKLPEDIEAGIINQALMKVKVNPKISLQYYLLYFDQILRQDISGQSNGTAIKNIPPFSVLKNLPLPLPPFAEQQRIVNLIENLFEKLDQAKELIQDALDSFENRKAAILHKAFNGELTKNWREENGIGMESWEDKQIGEFAFVTKLAGFEYTKNIAPNLVGDGIPLFKGKNVQSGKLVLNFESYIPKSISDELPRSKLKRKCLLTPYVGTIGNIAIFDGSFEAHLGSNVGKIEITNESITEEYLLYYLRSDYGYKELTKQKKATAQESISIQAIREVIVKVPCSKEQNEIVKILNDILNKESVSKELLDLSNNIDLIKKSILASAFRGDLGTNDPNEECSIELLKKMLIE